MVLLRAFLRRLVLLLLVSGPLALAGCAPPGPVAVSEATDAAAAAPARSARLGTQWGEGVDSRVSTLSLKRRSEQPLMLHTLPYSATHFEGEPLAELFLGGGRVAMRVLRDNGRAWPIHSLGGQPHLQGRKGERYILEYRNLSSRTLEIVATVDGLDVLSGQPGSARHRGYVLRAGQTLRIEGFRKSSAAVAAFRFAAVPDAYAANTPAGSAANVGVIGTAVFELIDPSAPDTPPDCSQGAAPCAFPGDPPGRFAPPPVRRN